MLLTTPANLTRRHNLRPYTVRRLVLAAARPILHPAGRVLVLDVWTAPAPKAEGVRACR